MTEDLVVVVEGGRKLVRRGGATVEVLANEMRHLVDALVEGGVKVADQQARES